MTGLTCGFVGCSQPALVTDAPFVGAGLTGRCEHRIALCSEHLVKVLLAQSRPSNPIRELRSKLAAFHQHLDQLLSMYEAEDHPSDERLQDLVAQTKRAHVEFLDTLAIARQRQ